jgi:ADP-heptose:LPS heptosyltransferase
MQDYESSSYLLPRIVTFFLKRMGKTQTFTLPADITGSRDLLLIDSGDATDLLFSAPLVNYFNRNHPQIQMTLLVHESDADIAKSIMKVNRIITYERKQLRICSADYLTLLKRLKRQMIDSVIMLGGRFSLERNLIAFASGARIRVGFENPLAFPFVNCEIRVMENTYEGNKMTKVIRSIGLKPDTAWGSINLSQRELSHARQLIHFRKPEKDYLTVGVDPGKGKTKHHVIPEIISYLANNLAGRRKAKFLILMNPWDGRLRDSFSSLLKGEIIDLKPANASETIALLSQCDLFLSSNTNLFHFAAALDVPTIGLFTKYDGSQWVPDRAPRVRIFKGTRGEKLSLKHFFSNVEEVLAVDVKV